MLFAFIDESYTQDRYYVAALVVKSEDMAAIGAALRASATYAEGFGVEPGAEFHGHRIMTGRDGWEAVRGKARAAGAIFGHALRGIAQLPVKVFIEGVDVGRLNARYSYPEPPHTVTLRHVLEDVNTYAASIDEDEVVVMCDEVSDQDLHSRRVAAYQVTGTRGFRPSKLARIDDFLFANSADSPGLQAVDLIVYLYRRRDAHHTTDARSLRLVEELWTAIRPVIRKHRRWDP